MEFVTGDAPQPGETPREESNPWTFSDPDTAFWRGDDERAEEGPHNARRTIPAGAGQSATLERPTFQGERTHTGEAAGAHAAGREDVKQHLVRGGNKRPEHLEHSHDKIDNRRFNPHSPYARTAPTSSEPVPPGRTDQFAPQTAHRAIEQSPRPAEPQHRPDHRTQDQHRHLEPIELPAANRTRLQLPGGTRYPIELSATASPPFEETRPHRKAKRKPAEKPPPPPEDGRTQPTVSLDRNAVPGQPSGMSRLSQAAQRPPSPLLETSPFWLTEEERAERAARWPEAETREKLTSAAAARRKLRKPHRPAAGLLGLIAMGLVAAFFAWVSAEPFWLAVGHGQTGLVTVTQCSGDGVGQRCTGTFQGNGSPYLRSKVTLLGVEEGQRNPGAVSPARMVNLNSRQAYVGETGLLVHLRWILGFVLVLVCGLGIAALTGSRQLETVSARRRALAMSVAGPLFLLLGFLFLAY